MPVRIFVVDNAPADGTLEMIRSDFPEVTAMSSERNIGFGAATNIAMGKGAARYVLALNRTHASLRGRSTR